MVQCSNPRPGIRGCIQRQIQLRLGDIELRIARFELHRVEPEKGAIEADRLVETWRIERDMNFHDRAPFRADTGTRLLRVQHSVSRNASRSLRPTASAR